LSRLVGVDVGGTFTDLFYVNEETGEIQTLKVPSTPWEPSEGIINALLTGQIPIESVDMFLHGTTIATNAIIQRRGCKAALITTTGFKDVLELGRRDRPNLYGLKGVQNPLIPRNLRFEVQERMNYKGEVIVPLDVESLRKIGLSLLDLEIETVIISFLHSYVNAAHEKKAGEVLKEINPDWYIVLSSEVLNEYYEFERTSTAVIEGYLRPLVSNYAKQLTSKLKRNNYKNPISIIQSNGGVLSIDLLTRNASNIICSGPAAGVIAATYVAKQAGFENIITGDMGGTSFDVSLVINGVPKVTEQINLDFRLPLRKSLIDIQAIGAGGGSIAWIDRGGILNVGPQSAGADPGPVCYGRGGTEPTVTDAQVVLGRIDAENPIGFDGALNKKLAEEAIIEKIAKPLGIGLYEAADAILKVVNNSMSGRMRAITIEKGYDPREMTFVAFGGAGPLHAASLIKEVGIKRALIPLYPGVICALGCVIADVKHDFAQTINLSQNEWQIESLQKVVDEKVKVGTELLQKEQIDFEAIEVELFADMSYEGQVHTIRVSLPYPLENILSIIENFQKTYKELYKHTLENIPIRLINLKVSVVGKRKPIQLKYHPVTSDDTSLSEALLSTRDVYFMTKFYQTPIYDRQRLPIKQKIAGPAIFVQNDTTIVLEPEMDAYVDEFGNLIMEVRHG